MSPTLNNMFLSYLETVGLIFYTYIYFIKINPSENS